VRKRGVLKDVINAKSANEYRAEITVRFLQAGNAKLLPLSSGAKVTTGLRYEKLPSHELTRASCREDS
jgi:hypothetical protein